MISGSERTALSSVASVEVFNLEEFQPQDVLKLKTTICSLKLLGFGILALLETKEQKTMLQSVTLENGNLETTFFSQTNAPSSVREEDLEILNSTEQVITVKTGIWFSTGREFSFST